jgi:hypothetical protein
MKGERGEIISQGLGIKGERGKKGRPGLPVSFISIIL